MKLQNLPLVFSLSIALTIGAVAQNPSIDKVKALINEEQYTKALELLNQLPQDDNTLLEKGWVYLGLQNYNQANEVFQQLYTKDPKNAIALTGLAARDLYSGNSAEAKIKFEKAVKLNKKNPATYAAIASSCLNAPVPDTALAAKYLETGLTYGYEKNADLHVLSGDLNLVKKNYGDAANDFQRALFYDPNNFDAQRKIGVVFYMAKNYMLSLEAFTKSINMNPDQVMVYKNLGDLYYLYGKFADAQKAYKTYMDRAVVTNDDIEQYAYALFFNKQYKESTDYLNQLMAKGGSENVYFRLKGYNAYELGDTEEGIKNMEKFFARRPSKILATDYSNYARLLEKQNRDSMAIIHFEAALKIDSSSLEYMDKLAKLYSRNKKQPEAIAFYQKMLYNGADAANVNFNIAREYYFLGDAYNSQFKVLKDSIARIDSIAKANPKKFKASLIDTLAIAQQADSLKAIMTGNFQNSLVAFKKVQELTPSNYGGFIWSGRILAILDPEWTGGTEARDNYDQALSLLEKGDTVRYKRPIIECLRYLASFYYLNSEKLTGEEATNMKNKSIEYFERIVQIDPDDMATQELLKTLKEELLNPQKETGKKEPVKKK